MSALIIGQSALFVAGFFWADRRTQRRFTMLIDGVARIDSTMTLLEALLATQEAKRNGGDLLTIHRGGDTHARLDA
jgi:hypothetical protein